MSINENKHYIKSLDAYISSKVIFHDYSNGEDTIIKLFDEYQIKWFNQQTEDDLHYYFLEAISFYKAEEEFLCNASSLIEMQRKLTTVNYGIMDTYMYGNIRDEEAEGDEECDWIVNGWKNNYGVAVYQELERVIEESDRNYHLKKEQENKEVV
jgi:hypothetical protein